MKKLVIALVLVAGALNASAQTAPPDNDFIRLTITDGGSPYYYESIFRRYMAGDTTLTVKDYYFLYYGYALQDAYKPLDAIPSRDKMLILLSKGGTMTEDDYRQAIEYAKEVMEVDPFSPTNINLMTYIYGKLGDEKNAAISADRFGKIIAAIESSGTGLEEESPWHILWSSHGKDVLSARELFVQRSYIVSKDVEYMMLQQRDYATGAKGYYFNYSRMYMKKPTWADSGKRVEGVEINGIKIKNNK